MYGWRDGWMDGGRDGWWVVGSGHTMKGWTGGWMDRWSNEMLRESKQWQWLLSLVIFNTPLPIRRTMEGSGRGCWCTCLVVGMGRGVDGWDSWAGQQGMLRTWHDPNITHSGIVLGRRIYWFCGALSAQPTYMELKRAPPCYQRQQLVVFIKFKRERVMFLL